MIFHYGVVTCSIFFSLVASFGVSTNQHPNCKFVMIDTESYRTYFDTLLIFQPILCTRSPMEKLEQNKNIALNIFIPFLK